ncbi:MAG: hypothetical protein ACRCW2_10450 [Cellulosilyticaceae bacterium]
MEDLRFSQDTYDLDGLLRISEEAMADFIFMIQEEDQEIYYLDRMENQKYDSSFSRFVRRAEDYLEQDELRGIFILFARGDDEIVDIFDGKGGKAVSIDTGDVTLDEATFYGMLIQSEDGDYVFTEALFRRESYQGDAHAQCISGVGALSERLEHFIREFE